MVTGPFESTWHVGVRFALSALAVYRLAVLFARDGGPWNLFGRLRSSAGESWRRFAGCVECLSVWVALPFAAFVGDSWLERFVAWWALSGAAVLVDRATRDPFEMESTRPS